MPNREAMSGSSVATSTVEDYLKGLYVLQQVAGAKKMVALGQLAQQVGVTAGTATVMVKRLAERELLQYEPRVGARLTSRGELQALNVLRRHRLIELFLVQVIGLDWSEVHDEAEVLEHAISDRLLEKIDQILGKPSYDPHGDPIPKADGRIHRRHLVSLDQCPVGEVVVARLADDTPAFLGFAKDKGLTPGVRMKVTDRDAIGDTVSLEREDGACFQLGLKAASKVLVEVGD